MSKYYIASCVFTWHYPQLSQRAQAYAEKQGAHSSTLLRAEI